MTINGNPVSVLFDTGSPSSFIRSDVAARCNLPLAQAPPFRFKGVVSDEAASTTVAARLELRHPEFRIDEPVYVTDSIPHEVIIGHPLIIANPAIAKLLKNSRAAQPLPNNPVCPIYDVNVIDMATIEDELEPSDIEDIFLVNVMENVQKNSFAKLPKWLQKKYADTVRDDLPPRGPDNPCPVEHEIDVYPDAKLPRFQPYNASLKLEDEITKIVDDLLEKGFVTPSKSPCSSPVVLVKKKDGSYRLCVDYRALNKVTVKDPFPLPRIENLLARVGDATIFTTLDLHSGYHQIPMKAADQHKTAFVTPNGKYEYTVMPFGLVNAPSTFARYMADLFRPLKFVSVYLDDILIASSSPEEHWKHVDQVLSILQHEKLVAKKKKCFFAQPSVEFLGYTVGHHKIEPLISKCQAINAFPVPKTVKQAQRFLGMVNYYRRFIPRCSQVAKPIQDFINDRSVWSGKQTKAFHTLQQNLVSKPVLVPFRTTGLYRLTTDASKIGIGAVLEEVDKNDKVLGVVGYFSKSLQGAQPNYPAGELELLGIIEALQHFRYILHGKHFKLRTDHISLLSIKNNHEPARRVQRWLDTLAEFDYELEYLAGPKNVVADAISRADYQLAPILEDLHVNPSDWFEDYRTDPLCAAALLHLKILSAEEIDISAAHRTAFDRYVKKFKLSRTFANDFSCDDNVLYYNDRLVVPLSLTSSILELYHDNQVYGGHFGTTATFAKVAPIFYWPKLQHSINEYIASCIQCQVNKAHRYRRQGLMKPLPVPEGRWIDISIDFASGFPETFAGNNLIMVVVDRFSKRAHFIAAQYPLSSYETINLLFRYIFAYHGFPRTITSDRDSRFTSKIYQEMAKRLGIKLTMSSSNHPQTDGQSERTIQILNRMLKSYVANNHKHWDTFLPMMEYSYNSTPNRTTKRSPFEADLGYIPNKPIIDTANEINARHFATVDLVKHQKAVLLQVQDLLTEGSTDMEMNNNEHRKPVEFEVGEQVLLHRDAYFTGGKYWKVQPIYLGPFMIVKKVNENAYELDLPSSSKKHRVINVQFLKKLKVRSDRYPKEPPHTSLERIARASEVTAVKGYDVQSQVYYCRMLDVDPRLTVEYSPQEFLRIPAYIRKSLVSNFNQLLQEQIAGREEEDIVFEADNDGNIGNAGTGQSADSN